MSGLTLSTLQCARQEVQNYLASGNIDARCPNPFPQRVDSADSFVKAFNEIGKQGACKHPGKDLKSAYLTALMENVAESLKDQLSTDLLAADGGKNVCSVVSFLQICSGEVHIKLTMDAYNDIRDFASHRGIFAGSACPVDNSTPTSCVPDPLGG